MMLVIGGLICGAVVLIAMYNGLIAKKNQVKFIFASLDALLKKRYDLIPNLVATVQEYAAHERGTLEEVSALRARAVSANLPPEERAALESQLSRSLGQLMVSVENYPQLKANENFMHLQTTLTEMEEQISAGRRAYNASVTTYNNALEMFPTNIVADMMSLTPATLFEAEEGERENVNVRSLFDAKKSA